MQNAYLYNNKRNNKNMAEEKKYTGYGTCTFANGEYTGELVDGVRQGYGVFKFSNYDIYDGDWEAGKMYGKGFYKFYDPIKDKYASKYEGDFNNGMREGKGKMTYANHDVYVGSWQNNQRTGNGICWFGSGDVFQGIWKFNQMVRGVFRKANGEVYDGEIKNGKCNGFGKLFWSNSKWFEGIFVDGKPYKGMLFTVDGKISEYKDGEQL